jgi:hypothetical protein
MIRYPMLSRREFALGLGAAIAASWLPARAAESPPKIVIHKDPNCGCCQGWADHLARNGFVTEVVKDENLGPLKAALGVPVSLQSCHTAKIDGYVIEGHVPASAIRRLLAERPRSKGLAVPGMPIGSPGMEGGEPETYTVFLFDEAGQSPFGRFREDKEVG